jgi:hypothetical protein
MTDSKEYYGKGVKSIEDFNEENRRTLELFIKLVHIKSDGNLELYDGTYSLLSIFFGTNCRWYLGQKYYKEIRDTSTLNDFVPKDRSVGSVSWFLLGCWYPCFLGQGPQSKSSNASPESRKVEDPSSLAGSTTHEDSSVSSVSDLLRGSWLLLFLA